jgi:hypothetical protein
MTSYVTGLDPAWLTAMPHNYATALCSSVTLPFRAATKLRYVVAHYGGLCLTLRGEQGGRVT